MKYSTTITGNFMRYALTALLLCTASVASADKVNLNTADAQTLQYIPGIGPAKAAEIVRVREEIGGYQTIEDLLEVPGIGAKTLLDIEANGSLDGGVTTLTEEMINNPPSKISSQQKPEKETTASG